MTSALDPLQSSIVGFERYILVLGNSVTQISLKESIRRWVLQNLPYDKSNAALSAELQPKDARDLLMIYHNWMNRHIQPLPRAVRRSRALDANPLSKERASDLANILDDIEKGGDLTKHLSRRIKVVSDVSKKPLKRRRDLDLMLNEWNVHHLHLSSELEPDGFVKRDGPLLFAVFTRDTAYLIDVLEHGDWTREHVLKVLAEEWPDAGVIHELKGNDRYKVVGLAVKYTDAQRRKLREAGINSLVEIDGRVYMPGGGMVASGNTFRSSRAADQLMAAAEKFEKFVLENPGRMKQAFSSRGAVYPEEPQFEFYFLEPQGFGVLEMKTRTLMQLG
jgi:hypothetical protein